MRIAKARKTGRSANRPYVPVIVTRVPGRDIETQVRGFAFATREEAVAFAQKTIEFNDQRCAKGQA
jgi:hypothetical protein